MLDLFDGLFPTPSEVRAVRTYSHRRANNTAVGPLPQLKPAPIYGPTRRQLTKQSPEPEPDADCEASVDDRATETAGEEEDEQGDEYYPYEVEYAGDALDDERDQDPEEADMAFTRKHRPAISRRRLRDEYELEESPYGDGARHVTSQTTSITECPSYPARQGSSTPAPSFTAAVRRRPSLVFNKHPRKPASYKKLDWEKPDTTKRAAANYIPGDGFTDSEARPNGLFHLTKKRKLHYSVPAVGSLDLTQASTPSVTKPTPTNSSSQPKEPRIIFKRKKRARDNSFLPPTPKKARQERERHKEKATGKQPTEAQLTADPGISAPYGQLVSSVVLGRAPNREERPRLPRIIEEKEGGGEAGKGDDAPWDKELETSVLVLDNGHDQVQQAYEQEVCVPFSDFIDTVKASQYSRSHSLPPDSSLVDPFEVEEGPSPLRRVFRRVNTT